MLTLFVVQSCADPKDAGETVASFAGLCEDVWRVPNIQAINEVAVTTNWYGVIYDNEHIDEPLLEGLKVFVRESEADVLVLLKETKHKRYFRCPRMFRRDVMLKESVLLPARGGLVFDTVLNGMIHDNDFI